MRNGVRTARRRDQPTPLAGVHERAHHDHQPRAIRRRELVNYVANKRGGDHYDPKRKGKAEEAARLLDDAMDVHTAMGRPMAFGELQATGQTLVSAPDVLEFLKRVSGTR